MYDHHNNSFLEDRDRYMDEEQYENFCVSTGALPRSAKTEKQKKKMQEDISFIMSNLHKMYRK